MDPHSASRSHLIVIWTALAALMILMAALPSLLGMNLEGMAGESPVKAEKFHSAMTVLALMMIAISMTLYRTAFHGKNKNAENQSKFFKTKVICWSLNEAIVLLGCIVSVTEKLPQSVWPFAGAGLALHFYMYPRRDPYEEQNRLEPKRSPS